MPNHWETSARPLFVKTVFVNGNRHAILFEKDPHRSDNPLYKKLSRSNSSLSFSSDFSILSSESRESNSERKTGKRKTNNQRKDLSLELQSCLVKLKLVSGVLDDKNKSSKEKFLCVSKDREKSSSKERGNSKQKKHKWTHEKTHRKKCKESSGEEYETGGRKNTTDRSCYVYNLENHRGKKKYCFVKISSQPSEFILNCKCNETHYDDFSEKNVVISATIHNLVMTSDSNKNVLENTFDYVFPFQNSELHWNDYLTKSYYNSLSDRVLHWLDLTRKRKREKENFDLSDEIIPLNNTERIFSRRKFLDEIKKTEHSNKMNRKILNIKNKTEGESFEDDIEGEVTGKSHPETFSSTEKPENVLKEWFAETSSRKPVRELKQLTQQENNEHVLVTHSDSSPKELQIQFSNMEKFPLKIQDILLNFHRKESFSLKGESRRNIREIRHSSTRQNKRKETNNTEENIDLTTCGASEKRTIEKGVSENKCDGYGNQSRCHCKRNLDGYVDKARSQILTAGFAERNQKSIDNLNITRARPVLIRNLLSPQQQNQICYLPEEKMVLASEKKTGRPQLHIFMPSVLLKDQSDDSTSECENLLNV